MARGKMESNTWLTQVGISRYPTQPQVQVLDRSETLPMSLEATGPELPSHKRTTGASCVRDVSWSSREPVMLSAAWGVHGTSSVARHEWKGLSKFSGRLEDWEEKRIAESRERENRRSRETYMPLRRSARLASFPSMFALAFGSDDE